MFEYLVNKVCKYIPPKSIERCLPGFILKIGDTQNFKIIQNSAGCQSTPLFRATNSYKFMHSGKRLLIIWAFDRKIIARVHIKTRKHKIVKRNIFLIREYKTVLDVEVHRFAE